jgi:hypothetical protein
MIWMQRLSCTKLLWFAFFKPIRPYDTSAIPTSGYFLEKRPFYGNSSNHGGPKHQPLERRLVKAIEELKMYLVN